MVWNEKVRYGIIFNRIKRWPSIWLLWLLTDRFECFFSEGPRDDEIQRALTQFGVLWKAQNKKRQLGILTDWTRKNNSAQWDIFHPYSLKSILIYNLWKRWRFKPLHDRKEIKPSWHKINSIYEINRIECGQHAVLPQRHFRKALTWIHNSDVSDLFQILSLVFHSQDWVPSLVYNSSFGCGSVPALPPATASTITYRAPTGNSHPWQALDSFWLYEPEHVAVL